MAAPELVSFESLEADLADAEQKVSKLVTEIEEVKKQQKDEEDKRKEAVSGAAAVEAQDRGLQLVSHRKVLEQELDRAMQYKTGARAALRMAMEGVDEEKKAKDDAAKEIEKDMALARALSMDEEKASHKKKQDNELADLELAKQLSSEESSAVKKGGNASPPGYDDEDEKVSQDLGKRIAVDDGEAGEGDPEISPERAMKQYKQELAVKRAKSYDSPPQGAAPQRTVSVRVEYPDGKYEDNPNLSRTLEKFKDGGQGKREIVFGYEDAPAEELKGQDAKSGPASPKGQLKRSNAVSPKLQNVKNRTLIETLDEGGHVASRDLVGTPYCEVCKSYLSTVLNVNWKDPKNNIMTGFLTKKKGALQLVRQSRWFILAEGHLVYYILPEDFGVTFPNGVVHLDGCIVHDKNPHSSEFIIERSRKQKFSLKAANVNEKRQWVQAIRSNDKQFAGETKSHKVSDLGHFCVECNRYINMDDFTLAEMDGNLEKFQKKKNSYAKKWCVYAKGHMAYFDNLNDVSNYQPHRIIHVEKNSCSGKDLLDAEDALKEREKKKELVFTIKCLERMFSFRAANVEEFKDWVEVLTSNDE